MTGVGGTSALQWLYSGRHHLHLIQRQLFDRIRERQEMSHVRRIEAPAENADAIRQ